MCLSTSPTKKKTQNKKHYVFQTRFPKQNKPKCKRDPNGREGTPRNIKNQKL